MITGANRGIGKETARQVAAFDTIEKVYLACRKSGNAEEAKASLEQSTGKKVFEVVVMDVSDLESVKEALDNFTGKLDTLVMNAGGLGGEKPFDRNHYGVTNIFASNVLGHFLLVEALIESNQLDGVVLYSGSEAARGVPRYGLARPDISNYSTEDFIAIANGDYFNVPDTTAAYSYVKLTATIAMSHLSQKYPGIRFITMSPGLTETTSAADNMLPWLRAFFKKIAIPYLLPRFGIMNKVDQAAARYIEGVTSGKFESGQFYASKISALTGPVVAQSSIMPTLNDKILQENAYLAIQSFLKPLRN